MKKQLIALSIAGLMLASSFSAAMAQDRWNRYNNQYYGGSAHPYVEKALIGGGAGAAIGGLLSSDGYRTGGAVKGAVLGAGLGMGYQYLKQQGTFGW